MTVYPRIDDALVDDVLRAVGAGRSDTVETLTAAFRAWLPAGSTAKWLAVDAGRTPPGVDPSTALEARLAGSLESWSCWPFCTGLGAVLAALGHDVRIVVEHLRAGQNVPLGDYHSALVVDGCLLDPFLGPSAPVAPGATAELRVTEGTSTFASRRRILGTGRYEDLRALIDGAAWPTMRDDTT